MDSEQEEQGATCSRKTDAGALALEQAARGSDGTPSLEGTCRCGTQGHSSVIVLGSAGEMVGLNDLIDIFQLK